MNLIILLLVCLYGSEVFTIKLPRPSVYVVTPSPRPLQIDEPRSAPFYYHNWMRRMDTTLNSTTMTTSTAKTKTPDLIFAEFEQESGDNMRKSIRKLLEKERIEPKTTSTTSKPIYVPDDEPDQMAHELNYGLPNTKEEKEKEPKPSDMENYYAMYNQIYKNKNTPTPVYLPLPSTTSSTSTTTTTTTTTPVPANVENIWHIIDNEKHDQYSGQWDEISVSSDDENTKEEKTDKIQPNELKLNINNEDDYKVDDNFAFPGFSTNPGNGAENESRAIRTEPNIRFPYVNLKPFQIKNIKKPPSYDMFSNSKKGNNMFTNLDSFQEIKNPVRGEAQDIVPMRQPVDRYNPAQPYLPPTNYDSKSKQSSPDSTPVKAMAKLVPPPPPPPPKVTDNDFPAPSSYESFPPYAPSFPDSAPKPPVPMFQPPVDSSDDSDFGPSPDNNGDNVPTMDLGYRYKPPQTQQFRPTLPPLTKPFKGYTYDKPAMTDEAPPPVMEMDEKPDFHGYHYNKPEPASPPEDHPPSYNYGQHEHHSTYHHDSDYPELIYNKPHGGMNSDTKGGDDMKGEDLGMMPPPPPPDMNSDMKPDMDSSGPPTDDHGFPHDFPGDFKFHHDFDDHDLYHYHHHHHPTTTTTTTTTTEMPRVNRYSYYYLGKKLYYLPLYFSVYFIVYVGALIIKAVLRHKIVYPNSWRPNDQTAAFFSKRSIDSWDLSSESLHEVTGKVTHAIATAAEKYLNNKVK